MGIFDGIGSSLISGGFGFLGANSANNAAGDLAADKFDWALTADSKKYRRAVTDLRAAGLNPILAAKGGISGGAVQPPGAQGMHNPFEKISSALQLKKLDAEINNINTDTQKKSAEAMLADNIGAKTVQEFKIRRSQMESIAASAKAHESLSSLAHEWNKSKLGRMSYAARKWMEGLLPFTPQQSIYQKAAP